MKLSPQPADILLPLSAKTAPAALSGKDVFAATMQDLMMSPSGPPVTPVIHIPAGALQQLAARMNQATLRHEAQASVEEEYIGTDDVAPQTLIAVTSTTVTPVPRDEMRHPLIPQPSVQASSPTEESFELRVSLPAVKNSIEETVLPQSREPGLTADTHAPSRAKYKAGSVTCDPVNPASAHSPGTMPAATIQAQCPSPVSVPQPVMPEQTFSEKNVQPAMQSLNSAGDSRRNASMSRPVVMAPTTASNSRSELLQPAQEAPLKKFGTVTNSQPPGLMTEKMIPGTLPKPNQDILPGPAVHSKEAHEATASQADAHASQEAGRTSSAGTNPVVAAAPAMHTAPELSPAQHLPSANTPDASPAMHRPETLSETHRAQENTAQVLQRMDAAASSGAVQLRADARHLDVGVSSGTLGWVEVRATASSSGKVDATLHVQTNSSAHLLTAQSKEIANYARDHSVELGQISVGVGTGDSARDHTRSPMYDGEGKNDIAPARRAVKSPASNEPQQPAERLSFISVQA